jgi:hypothetical protein
VTQYILTNLTRFSTSLSRPGDVLPPFQAWHLYKNPK